MIEAENLFRAYAGHDRVTAVNRVSFRIEAGERVSIVGRSGSGKTTLLNLLAGLDTPTAGSLCVDSQELSGMSRRQLAEYRRCSVGVIFQSYQLIAQRTAIQNVELSLILNGLPRFERRAAAERWLDAVDLLARRNHYPWQLSGGEQQRVAIARALIKNPPVVLADEPTGNLDSETADHVAEMLVQICQEQNSTLILVTHDESLAHRCCSRSLKMHDGRLSEN